MIESVFIDEERRVGKRGRRMEVVHMRKVGVLLLHVYTLPQLPPSLFFTKDFFLSIFYKDNLLNRNRPKIKNILIIQ